MFLLVICIFIYLETFGVLNWSLGRGDCLGELVETGGSIVMFFFEFESDGIEPSKHHIAYS